MFRRKQSVFIMSKFASFLFGEFGFDTMLLFNTLVCYYWLYFLNVTECGNKSLKHSIHHNILTDNKNVNYSFDSLS